MASMLHALRAYGPDAVAQWADNGIALGRCLYRRLPEDRFDRQPLAGGGGRWRLVADLRLDNREQLFDQLGVPHPERAGQADADLLLSCIERWGPAALDRLNGDYAFALWDARERELLLARDPLGERPLYYHVGTQLFAFASMPMGLHALPDIPRRIDADRLIPFVGLIPEMGRSSYYAGIEQLAPGHVLRVRAGEVKTERYWNPQPRDLGLRRFEDARDAFRDQLDRAVRTRLRGSGPAVGTHLSAGWDSSAVATTAARLIANTDRRVQAFTARPGDAGPLIAPRGRIVDEGPIASRTAAMHPNIDHREVIVSGRSPIAQLDRLLGLYDRPLYALCNHTWLSEIKSQARAEGITVMLTGEMGNFTVSSAPYTILADYIRTGRWREWLREATVLARKGPLRWRGVAASSFGPWVPDPFWRLVRGLSSRPEVSVFTALHPKLALSMEREREARRIGLASRPSNYFKRTVRAMHYYDTGTHRKAALAGWGIDERDPTADRELTEFCLSLPLEMLLKNGERRPLARAALADRLPPEVLDERRKGLQAADWHLGMGRDLERAKALVARFAGHPLASSMLDIPLLRRLLQDWPTGGWSGGQQDARYRGALLGALAAGHFIVSVEPL